MSVLSSITQAAASLGGISNIKRAANALKTFKKLPSDIRQGKEVYKKKQTNAALKQQKQIARANAFKQKEASKQQKQLNRASSVANKALNKSIVKTKYGPLTEYGGAKQAKALYGLSNPLSALEKPTTSKLSKKKQLLSDLGF